LSADTLFLDQISKLKKLVIFNVLNRFVAIALVVFLGIYAAARGFEKTGLYHPGAFYAILIGISLGFSLVYAFFKREGFSNILIDIDRRLKLKDRLSTAYEYQKRGKKRGKKSDMADLLIGDAGRALSMLHKKQIFPRKFPTVHLLLSILILANISLFFVDHFSAVSEQTDLNQEKVKKIISLVETYTSKKAEDGKQIKKKERHNRYQQLKNIAKKLDRRSMSRDKLLASLNKLLREIQGENFRLAKELGSKIGIENIQDMAIQRALRLEKLSSNEQKKLNMMLSKMFDNMTPGAISNDLAGLNELHSLSELLEQVIDEVESDAAGNKTKSGKKDGNAQRKNDSETVKDGTSGERQGKGASNPKKDGKDATDPAGFDRGQESGRDGEGGGDTDEGPFSVGDAKSKGNEKSPYELEKVKGPALDDKTISAQKEIYSVPIRSLTAIGKAKLKGEDITRPYRQEIESILKKADIPLNYREYIKNYFISIGLETGKKSK